MGYNKFNLAYIFDVVSKYDIKNVLELGNQCINNRDITHIQEKWGKEYFVNNGFNHTSIDWNGNNGALNMDLTKPLPVTFHSMFDLVTNCGTSEHILLQYEVFENLHKSGKIGCVYINSLPLDTNQNKKLYGAPTNPHGIYEYNTMFFIKLCELCNYEVININPDQATWANTNQGYCNSVYKKVNDDDFISKDKFSQLEQFLNYYPDGSIE